MDIRAYNKLVFARQDELGSMFTTLTQLNHEERLSAKMICVEEIRRLRRHGESLRGIARIMALDFRTVRKYADENFNPVHAAYGNKKYGYTNPICRRHRLYAFSGR